MIKDADSHVGIEVPTKVLALVAMALLFVALGVLSFSALGSSSLML